MNSVIGDVRDFAHLKAVISENKPEIVFHLAAQSVVRYSYEDPVETYSTNVLGTANLLETIRQLERPCVLINVTSDKCYENREWIWGYRETDPLGGHDPYSNSKACAELITAAFRKSFFRTEDFGRHRIALATARAGNVIGGGDWTRDQLIPDIMRAFMENRPVLIRSPGAIRPWQFVLEALNGYLCLAEKLWDRGAEFAEAWNFGPEEFDVKPVSWIVDSLSKLWGEGARWEVETIPQPHEAHALRLDSSKARTLIGWTTKLPLPRALEWTLEWYKGYWQHKDVGQIVLSQISCYEELWGVRKEP